MGNHCDFYDSWVRECRDCIGWVREMVLGKWPLGVEDLVLTIKFHGQYRLYKPCVQGFLGSASIFSFLHIFSRPPFLFHWE